MNKFKEPRFSRALLLIFLAPVTGALIAMVCISQAKPEPGLHGFFRDSVSSSWAFQLQITVPDGYHPSFDTALYDNELYPVIISDSVGIVALIDNKNHIIVMDTAQTLKALFMWVERNIKLQSPPTFLLPDSIWFEEAPRKKLTEDPEGDSEV